MVIGLLGKVLLEKGVSEEDGSLGIRTLQASAHPV